MKKIMFPYYNTYKELEIDENLLKAVLVSEISDYKACKDEKDIIKDALKAPIGTDRLRDIAVGKKNILIVTGDHTRPVPSAITLPILIDEIRAGNKDAEITILVATGLHRATTKEEQIEKFGKYIVDNFKIIIHDAFDKNSCEYVCELPSGASFEVNKLALTSDLVITEGFIEPHFFAGFSGGRKSILPGICSYTTVVENHSAKAISHPMSKGGIMRGNIINEDMIYAAKLIGVGFTLNVALNGEKKIIAAFSGDIELSHAKGCEFVDKLSRVEAVQGDIVITSNGGLPLDQNLYQCPKAISTALECAEPGGVLIIVASCGDGLGGEHFERIMTMGSPQVIYDYIMSIPPKETIPEQWCAQSFAKILLEHTIIVVSDFISKEVIESVNMLHAATIEEAVSKALEIVGEGARVVAIPDGVSTIAIKNN